MESSAVLTALVQEVGFDIVWHEPSYLMIGVYAFAIAAVGFVLLQILRNASRKRRD